MRKTLLSAIAVFTTISSFAQITITAADLGSAGDSIVIGTDNNAPAGLNVGGTGSQTWDFSTLSVSNINTLKFEDPANTSSGNQFPNADLATERQSDTIFYDITATAFSIDGIAGDALGLGTSLAIDFNPNVKQLEFPSTIGSSFTATSSFDSTASCVQFGQGSQCDSARIKRTVNLSSVIDAHGDVETPGGVYTSVRQYLMEVNIDTVWIKLPAPFSFWTQVLAQDTTVHNYRWYANGEDWPVLWAVADAQNGDILTAEFKVDDNLISYTTNTQRPLCNGDCNGSATVSGLGGVPPYSYQWPASAGGGTAAYAGNLCAGNYDVTITDANGDTTIETVELTEPDVLSASASIQGVSMGNDGAIDLNVNGGNGAKTFAWTGPNGFTASTEDLDSISEGSYTVFINDLNNCNITETYNVELTNISETDAASFNMYPNPVQDELTIVATSYISNIRIVDLLGNLVLSSSGNNSLTNKLNLSEVASGLYLIEVKTEAGIYLKKLTIE